jgi:hypothetical protein
MSDGGQSNREGGDAPDLGALRSRLDALHRSVEALGRPDAGVPAPPPAQEAHGPPGAYPVPPADQQPPAPPPPFYRTPPDAPQAPPPAPASPYETSAAPDYAEPYADPYVADPYAAPPAATNGGGEVPADEFVPAANVTILDVGPFADLVELRLFEEAVARLETVRDVHVRRFGHNRAKIEVGMLGPQPVGRELYRLGRPMEVEPGPDGEVIVDFSEIVAEESVAPEQPNQVVAAPPATAMPTAEPTASESESSSSTPAGTPESESEEKQ